MGRGTPHVGSEFRAESYWLTVKKRQHRASNIGVADDAASRDQNHRGGLKPSDRKSRDRSSHGDRGRVPPIPMPNDGGGCRRAGIPPP
jgi:hypothetical protein